MAQVKKLSYKTILTYEETHFLFLSQQSNSKYRKRSVCLSVCVHHCNKLPVLNTAARLHRLKFGSNVSHTTLSNFIQVYHWRISNQLQKFAKSFKSKAEEIAET